MEREKNEQLTAKEIEKEHMKQQLIVLGIYDETDTFEQMKDLLGFLNNSETTPNVAIDNKQTQKKDNEQHADNECLSELTSETDALQQQRAAVAQESSKMLYKPNRTSPTVAQQERKSSRHSSSPESSSTTYDARGLGQGRKNTEYDEATSSEKQQQQHEQHEQSGANHSVPLKPGNGAQECQNSSADAKTMQCAAQSTYYQRQERWRMNPLDVCINENDVPLQQPRSRLTTRKCTSSSGCHNKMYTSEQHDQKIRALGQHLREMADLWYSWQRPANAKFEWGVPIEVGTANGSLDRKPVTEPKTEPIKAECTYRDSYERSSKRKANSLIAKECASLNKVSSSDEDDQYDFARVKKKKTQSDDKSSNVADCADQQYVRTSNKHEAATLTARQQHSYDNSDDNAYTDDEDVRSPRRRKTENDENEERMSPVLITQPKRAIPSTPKARPNLPRFRRGKLSLKIQRTGNEDMGSMRSQKKDNVMTDEEIRRKLEGDSDGEEVAEILRKDMETRSSKEAKSRLQERRLLSNNMETLKETSAMYKEKESNREKKVDLGAQRKKEDKCEVENKDVNWEHQLLDDDNDDDDETEINQRPTSQNGNWRKKVIDSTNNISCPICNKLFPPDEIENHAADCDQFETNDEEDDDDSDQLKCNICDNYKTKNGLDYQQHVKRCIDSKKNKKHLQESDDVDIVPIPPSHRTYKPSGKKATSSSPEIDLMNQSPSYSRTRVFTNRKRKH